MCNTFEDKLLAGGYTTRYLIEVEHPEVTIAEFSLFLGKVFGAVSTIRWGEFSDFIGEDGHSIALIRVLASHKDTKEAGLVRTLYAEIYAVPSLKHSPEEIEQKIFDTFKKDTGEEISLEVCVHDLHGLVRGKENDDITEIELELGFNNDLTEDLKENQEFLDDQLFDSLMKFLENTNNTFRPQRATFNEAHSTLRGIYALCGARVGYEVSTSPLVVRDILMGATASRESDNSSIPVGTVLSFKAVYGKSESAVRYENGMWGLTGRDEILSFEKLISRCGEGTIVYVPVKEDKIPLAGSDDSEGKS